MKRTGPAIIILLLLLAAVAALGALVLLADGDDDTAAGTATTVTNPVVSTPGPDASDPPPGTTDPSLPVTLDYAAEFVEARCRFDVPMDASPRCGWLTVPENRAVDNGREVRLHVAVFESGTAPTDATPIIYLAGGPGGETLDTLLFSFDTVWSPLLDHGDLIFFDQRGVGQSEPSLDCPEELELMYELLDDDLEPAEFVALELEAIGECRDRLADDGIDFTAYNSAQGAADVADLREALGYEEWNLLGISYGTRLAQTVMRDHPDGVRAVILDATYPIEANLAAEIPRNMDRAFDHFFAACAADTGCAETYPDLRNRVFSLAARLDDEPITVSVRDFITGNQYSSLLTGSGLLGAMFQALYSDPLFPQLPEMVAELEQGQTTLASLILSNDLSQAGFLSLGMYLSVQCHEEVAFTTPAEIDAGLEGFGEFADVIARSVTVSNTVIEVCELWGAGAAPPLENEVISSPIPTLVLAGSYDPITPPRWGRDVAANLQNAFFVEFPTLAHGTSIAAECPTAITLAFLADPASPPDTSCIADMDPVSFIEEPFDPGSIVMELFEEDFFGLTVSGVFPADWEQVQPGAWARGSTGLDQTAIVQQAVDAPGIDDAFILGLFADQFGIDGEFRFDREVDAPGGTWLVSTGTFETFVVDVAIQRSGSIVGAVVLISEQDERDALFRVVLEPVLEEFRVS